jgi:Cu-processing system permease protein
VIRRTITVARDLLREARARRWVLALFAGVTLSLAALGLGLELEVVDGALAAARLFGGTMDRSIRAADVALRPLFEAASWIVFYGGLLLGVVVCADFGPSLLEPGRIEGLLALPVRRAELLAGTFLGVLGLVFAGSLYGGAGLAILIWVKAGVFNVGPIVAAALAAVAFSSLYAAMLLAAVAVRSAGLSAMAGLAVYLLSVVAGKRAAIGPLFPPGARRALFLALTAPFPRLTGLADAALATATGQPLAPSLLAGLVAGTLLFSAGLLAVAVALFERKDY